MPTLARYKWAYTGGKQALQLVKDLETHVGYPESLTKYPLKRESIKGLHDAWTRCTAGGSAAPTFVQNPQYRLTVPRPSPVSIFSCAVEEY
ncbi:hypothetical protein MAPG_04529 [Magnaporthiopsis poae ATCC 64411]|uniref:Uncharacterized protein n=1 Tax=Magnaporthiopsis poae (strain ATCC 64411 / 73-15) TaxID=644358 RepID=A0A0C4DWZ4_MAGP6|nr:hypothetical protein MAPG_04529 [Magnaporthiopsis poae ATCC 64411]